MPVGWTSVHRVYAVVTKLLHEEVIIIDFESTSDEKSLLIFLF